MTLVDICRATNLPQRAVAGAIIILMQHALVHTTSLERDDAYEFDEAECLNRLRYGRILAITSTWQPLEDVRDVAVEAVRLIMVHGRLTVAQLRRVLATKASSFRLSQIDRALLLLAKEGFLRPTAPQLQISPGALLQRKIKVSHGLATLIRSNVHSKKAMAILKRFYRETSSPRLKRRRGWISTRSATT